MEPVNGDSSRTTKREREARVIDFFAGPDPTDGRRTYQQTNDARDRYSTVYGSVLEVELTTNRH